MRHPRFLVPSVPWNTTFFTSLPMMIKGNRRRHGLPILINELTGIQTTWRQICISFSLNFCIDCPRYQFFTKILIDVHLTGFTCSKMCYLEKSILAWWRHNMETPFVKGIDRSPVVSPHKWPVMQSLGVSFVVRLNNVLNEQSSDWWLRRHGTHVIAFNRQTKEWEPHAINYQVVCIYSVV